MTDAASGKDGAMTFEEWATKEFGASPNIRQKSLYSYDHLEFAFRAGAESKEREFAERAHIALPLEAEER